MQSGVAPVAPIVASLTSIQPGVENSDDIVEAVHVADAEERLTGADSAGAAKGVERGKGELRLGERQPGLGT
jgi:hypothetical protein